MVCELYFTVKFSTAPTLISFIKTKHSFSFCVLSPLPSHSHPWRNTTIKTTPLAQEPINVTSVRNLNSHHNFDFLEFGACRGQDPHHDTHTYTQSETRRPLLSGCSKTLNDSHPTSSLITAPQFNSHQLGGHRMPCPAQATKINMTLPCPVSTHPPTNTETH